MRRILALIAARAGSKGLSDKNVRPFCGTPLLVHAVRRARAAARSSESWRIVVSTDSKRYAALARRAGAEVPYLRPGRLARDTSRLIDTVLHALDRLGDSFDAVLLIGVTTPLVTPSDIRRALGLHFESGASVASVTPDRAADAWRFELRRGRLTGAPRRIGRRQDSPERVVLTGGVYVASPEWLRRHRQFVVAGETLPLLLPHERALDIEDAADLAIATFLGGRKHEGIRRWRQTAKTSLTMAPLRVQKVPISRG